MRSTRSFLTLAIVGVVTTACTAPDGGAAKPESEQASEVVASSDVEWGPLNPARGDRSPKAGTLWGDRADSGPSGFLVQFADGFSSPPHIHNVSYRGVVISGLVHNDDPAAAEMWMPAGSFWTQPAGEAHITSANGNENVAYIEIEDGPYLVRPTEQAFDNGERPINVHASNLVWVDPPAGHGPKLAHLWGDPQGDQPSGTLVKLPAGFAGEIRGHGSALRAVVIQGRPLYGAPVAALEPGSYFGSQGGAAHELSCDAGAECVIYVRTKGRLEIE